MVRTQIQLEEKHLRRLKKIAREAGISLAELIRRCVLDYLERDAPSRSRLYERAALLGGAFEDREGATDVSAAHDRYLDDSFR